VLSLFLSIVDYNFWKHNLILLAMIILSSFLQVKQTSIDNSLSLYFIGVGVSFLVFFLFFVFNLIFLVILCNNKIITKMNDYITENSRELLPLNSKFFKAHIFYFSAWCFISLIIITSYLVTFAYSVSLIDTECAKDFVVSPLIVMKDITFLFSGQDESTIKCISNMYPYIRNIFQIIGAFGAILALFWNFKE
jgi:hypothetical protein